MDSRTWQAFLDEFAAIKQAAASGRLTISKSRSGRRPMSVDTLLRKEKDGTLYKDAGLARIRRLSEAMIKHPERAEALAPVMMSAAGKNARRTIGKGIGAASYWSGRGGQHHGAWGAAIEAKMKKAEYQEVDPRNPTIRQAVRYSRGDVPNREDIPGRTGTEFRPNMMGAGPAGRDLAPEGFNR